LVCQGSSLFRAFRENGISSIFISRLLRLFSFSPDSSFRLLQIPSSPQATDSSIQGGGLLEILTRPFTPLGYGRCNCTRLFPPALSDAVLRRALELPNWALAAFFHIKEVRFEITVQRPVFPHGFAGPSQTLTFLSDSIMHGELSFVYLLDGCKALLPQRINPAYFLREFCSTRSRRPFRFFLGCISSTISFGSSLRLPPWSLGPTAHMGPVTNNCFCVLSAVRPWIVDDPLEIFLLPLGGKSNVLSSWHGQAVKRKCFARG